MKKIVSLFKRNYDGDRLVYNEVVPGAEWVINGEGWGTVKHDGTCCMIRDGKLYKRYDRKLTKSKAKRLKRDKTYRPKVEDYKAAPDGWEAAEPEPDHNTGHWPGWVPVGDGSDDRYHRQALANVKPPYKDGTYELVGPKIQGNPHEYEYHLLVRHGYTIINPPRDYEGLKDWFELHDKAGILIEGVVWHHPDGRMVKIKRRDFGFPWPPK